MKRKSCFKKVRGEITTKQLVSIIILIVSFVVILFLIMRLDLGETSVKEICHNSVVLKAKNPAGGLTGGDFDCKTSYVCISGGEDCEDFVYDVKLKVDVEKKNEILKILAEEMADCWWMFGEGELNLGGASRKNQCAICSQIKFDKKLQEKEITYGDLREYLFAENIAHGLSGDDFKSHKNILDGERYSVVTGFNTDVGKDTFYPPVLVDLNSAEVKKKINCNTFDVARA
jgi:hypothetical protein